MNLLDLTRSAIGIAPDIVDFLRKYLFDDVFAIDGAIEILRAPLPPGWGPSSVEVKMARNDEYLLDPQAVQLLTPYRNRMAGLGWETKHRIATLELNSKQPPTLRAVFVPITYEEGAGFHRSLIEGAAEGDALVLAVKERLANQLIRLGKYSTPGVAVVHTSVITSDNRLVLCQRSPHAGYHPSRWSISFEEQINQTDLVFGNAALSAAAIRGFQEEFASGGAMMPDDAHVLGVFLEYGILNIGFCVYIETTLSFDEIEFNWQTKAKDKWEAVEIVGEPFTLDNAVRLLQSSHYGETRERRNKFHPTSKYRLLLAVIYRFGLETVINAFKPV